MAEDCAKRELGHASLVGRMYNLSPRPPEGSCEPIQVERGSDGSQRVGRAAGRW
jgi:hypothetical protein